MVIVFTHLTLLTRIGQEMLIGLDMLGHALSEVLKQEEVLNDQSYNQLFDFFYGLLAFFNTLILCILAIFEFLIFTTPSVPIYKARTLFGTNFDQ